MQGPIIAYGLGEKWKDTDLTCFRAAEVRLSLCLCNRFAAAAMRAAKHLCVFTGMFMKSVLSSRWRGRWLAIVCGCSCAPALPAQPLPFAGEWLRDVPAGAQAAYPTLVIQEASISWSGPNKSAPTCVQQFTLKKEKPGTVYANGRGTRFVAGAKGSLPTYLLQLGASTCSGVEDEVRISFPLVYDTDHIEVIDYVHGRPIGARRFHRKK